MSNLIQIGSDYFIKSEKIRIFPCAYRGTKEVTLSSDPSATRTIAFQPTARSFSEENLTNNYTKLGTTASYLISNSYYSDEHKIELLLGGYYLVVWLTDDDITTIADNDLQFCLSTIEVKLYDYATESGGDSASMQASTTIIQNLASSSTAVGDQLDINNGGTYYFSGVKLAKNTTNYTYSLNIFDKDKNFLYESRPIFENLKTGHGFNSLVNAGNTVDEVAACIANGDYSIALGKSTIVDGDCGFAIGEFAVSNGNAAVACGTNAVANGNYSFSCGDTTNAIASGSVAFGKNTQAYSENQLVIGQFNEIPAGDQVPEAAFTIGIGASETSRKNLLNILKNGDVVLDGNNNAVAIGTASKKASLLVSDTLNLDDAGNLTLSKNAKFNFGTGLVIDNTNTAANTAKMTLNGSFHETSTFTLGTYKNAPDVKISSSETSINYSNVNIGNDVSNVAILDNNITVHNKDIIIDTANTIKINNATIFDTSNSTLNNTLHITNLGDSRTVVTVGNVKADTYPDASLATKCGLFTNGNLQAIVSDDKKFSVEFNNDQNKLSFGNKFEVDAKTSQSTFNTNLNILNKVNITNANANCFEVVIDSTSITASAINNISAVKATISCSNVTASANISAATVNINNPTLSDKPLTITPTTIEGPVTIIKTPAITVDASQVDINGKAIVNCNSITSAKQDEGTKINGENLISANAFKLGKLQGESSFVIEGSGSSSSKFFNVNGTTRITGDTDVTGNLTVSGTVKANELDTNSDVRLKENIVDFVCEKSILDLPVKKFSYIADESKTVHIGCLAQDLQQICPELVHTDSNGYLSIEESKLIYLLIDEVKKLKEEVKKLEEK